jgi:site-specific DNA-methyltransferase (adenine-specific)
MEFMRGLPDKYYELAIVDPPYGIGAGTGVGVTRGKKNQYTVKYWDISIPIKEYWDHLMRVSKNQIVWGGNYMTEYLKPTPCWILWDKGFSENVTFAQFDMAWTSFSSSAKKYDFIAASYTHLTMALLPIGASGLPDNLVEAYLAGITPSDFIVVLF